MNTAPESDAQIQEESAHQVSLVLLNGPQPGDVLPLNSSRRYSVGRDSGCTLTLSDARVSPIHARLWCDEDGWRIVDCDSVSGTFVNARRVESSPLRPGDLIRIGKQMLVFSNEAPRERKSGGARFRVDASSAARRIFSAEPNRPIGIASDAARRKLEQISRLIRQLPEAESLESMIDLALGALRRAVGADTATLCLADVQGKMKEFVAPTDKSSQTPQILASWVIQRDEAMSIELNENLATDSDADRGAAMGAPVPGERAPRAALECFRASSEPRFDPDDLDFVITVAQLLGIAWRNLESRLPPPKIATSAESAGDCLILGKSPAVQSLREQIVRVAPTDSTVLTLGESGTGKELVAHEIHNLSERASGPFVAVNCAAYNDSLLESELFGHERGAFTGADRRRLGQFERADRGTIFLDEVGELSNACQAKLLRLLEGQPFARVGGAEPIQVDVRIVAATNRNLPEMVRSGAFREDLWYRLRVIELRTPPLRERGDDVVQLANHFLENYRCEIGRGPQRFSEEAEAALRRHAWPGNIRELKNSVERAVVLEANDEIKPESLGLAAQVEPTEVESATLSEVEIRHIQSVLAMVGGNKTEACRILGIGRATLYGKLNRKRD